MSLPLVFIGLATLIVFGAFLAVANARRASTHRAQTGSPRAGGDQVSVAAEETRSVAPSEGIARPPRRSDTGRRVAELGRTPFAVVDVETTGFHPVPDGTHRVVEVAILRMSPEGRIEDEYVTLVNPQRRMGATHVHGIRSSDVADAPHFAQIAGDVGARLSDAIVVGHNLPFDLRFLRGEYRQAGIAMPDVPALCTLALAYRFADVPCRKLGFLCEEYGIAIDEHSALGDARAVSQLLLRFLDIARQTSALDFLGDSDLCPADTSWFGRAPSGLSVRRGRRGEDGRTAVETLIAKRTARAPVALAEERYLDAVELAVGDGEVTPEESAALVALAADLQVNPSDLHRRYVQSLVTGAKSDGIVTAAESEQLKRISELLNIPGSDLESMLDEAPQRVHQERIGDGSAVCFLGSFDLPVMAELVSAASSAKLVIRKNITATVNVVVVESANAERKRQDRARALGARVVTVAEFMNLVTAREAVA